MRMNGIGLDIGLPADPTSSVAGKQDSAEAAKNFESFFVGYVFQQVFQSIPKSEFMDGGPGHDIYQSMFVEELSSKIANQGLGLAKQIEKKIQGSEEILR